MGQAISVKDIRTGDKFWHDGTLYEAESYAQQLSGPWFRIPLVRWTVTDPRALRLHKSGHVLRA